MYTSNEGQSRCNEGMLKADTKSCATVAYAQVKACSGLDSFADHSELARMTECAATGQVMLTSNFATFYCSSP